MPPVVDDLEAAEAVVFDFGVLEASLLQGGFHGAVGVDILEMVFGAELELHWVVANLLLASFLVTSSVPGSDSAAEMALIPGRFLALGTARVARAACVVVARLARVAQAALALVARVALVALTLVSAHVVLPRVVLARVVALVVALVVAEARVVVPLVLDDLDVLDVLDHSLPGTRFHVVFLLVMVLLALEDGAVAGLRWHFH